MSQFRRQKPLRRLDVSSSLPAPAHLPISRGKYASHPDQLLTPSLTRSRPSLLSMYTVCFTATTYCVRCSTGRRRSRCARCFLAQRRGKPPSSTLLRRVSWRHATESHPGLRRRMGQHRPRLVVRWAKYEGRGYRLGSITGYRFQEPAFAVVRKRHGTRVS